MALSICFNFGLRPPCRVRSEQRSSDGFSWEDKRTRRNYGSSADELGDISALYCDEPVVGDSSVLVHDCTMHIKNFIYNRNLPKAHHLLDLMIEKHVPPNEQTYIALMKGYSRMRRNDAVFNLLEDMGNRGVKPTEKTLNMLMSTCAKTGDIGTALSFFDEMRIEYGVQPNTVCYNSLLKVCAKGRNLKAAKAVLEDMTTSEVSRDIITLNTLINVHAVCCNKDNAKQFLKECRALIEELDTDGVTVNVVTFNTLLKLCARGSLSEEALELLDEMKIRNLNPDVVTYATLMGGILKNDTLSTKEVPRVSSEVIDDMKKEGLQLDAQAYTVLMNLAFKTSDLNRSVGLFQEMKELGIKPTVKTYGTMIKCYAKLGDPSTGDAYLKPCLDLLEECENEGIRMDVPGFVSLLSACANVANLDSALKVWNKINEQGIEKSVSMYNAMINVCLTSDAKDKAFAFLHEMKTSGIGPNEVTFRTFITHFMKKKDSSGAQRFYDEMKTLGLKPDRESLKMLKALRVF